ncbi:MAG: CoA transferase, partial [Dehalococcoidia bacterium]
TGEGQHVDVSVQVAVIWTLMNATSYPVLHKESIERAGSSRKFGFLVIRNVFPCKDGHVSALIVGGVLGASSTSALVRWMDEEGMAPDFMKQRDWAAWDFAALAGQGEEGVKDIQAVESHVSGFFLTKTKAELYERAITDRILLAPCNTIQDLVESPQLRAREFWVDVYHPELDASLTYPGPHVKFSETPIQARRRAPLIGEHNKEVYIGELGLTEGHLGQLKTRGVI